MGAYGGTKPNLTVFNDTLRYLNTYDNRTLIKVNFKKLYDEKSDPGKMRILINDPAYFDHISSMQNQQKLVIFEYDICHPSAIDELYQYISFS